MRCKNCNHKIVLVGRDRFGAYVYRHIWENELGYCQSKGCDCAIPKREVKSKINKGKEKKEVDTSSGKALKDFANEIRKETQQEIFDKIEEIGNQEFNNHKYKFSAYRHIWVKIFELKQALIDKNWTEFKGREIIGNKEKERVSFNDEMLKGILTEKEYKKLQEIREEKE